MSLKAAELNRLAAILTGGRTPTGVIVLIGFLGACMGDAVVSRALFCGWLDLVHAGVTTISGYSRLPSVRGISTELSRRTAICRLRKCFADALLRAGISDPPAIIETGMGEYRLTVPPSSIYVTECFFELPESLVRPELLPVLRDLPRWPIDSPHIAPADEQLDA